MFDIGGLELFLVLIIALLVIGPERMPEVARSIGRFVGRTKRFIQSVREESELRETVEELRRELDLKEEAAALRNLEQDLHDDLYGNLHEAKEKLEEELNLNELQRPTFGGDAPPPLHMDQMEDPTPAGSIASSADRSKGAAASPAQKTENAPPGSEPAKKPASRTAPAPQPDNAKKTS